MWLKQGNKWSTIADNRGTRGPKFLVCFVVKAIEKKMIFFLITLFRAKTCECMQTCMYHLQSGQRGEMFKPDLCSYCTSTWLHITSLLICNICPSSDYYSRQGVGRVVNKSLLWWKRVKLKISCCEEIFNGILSFTTKITDYPKPKLPLNIWTF